MNKEILAHVEGLRKASKDIKATEAAHVARVKPIQKAQDEHLAALRNVVPKSWEAADARGPWLAFDTRHLQFVVMMRDASAAIARYEDGDAVTFTGQDWRRGDRLVFVKNIVNPFNEFLKSQIPR